MTTLHISGYVETRFSRTITGDSREDCLEKLKAMEEQDMAFIYSDQKIIEDHPYLDAEVNVEFDGKEHGITIIDDNDEEMSVSGAIWLHDNGVSSQ